MNFQFQFVITGIQSLVTLTCFTRKATLQCKHFSCFPFEEIVRWQRLEAMKCLSIIELSNFPRLFSSAVYSVLHLLVSFLPAFFILLVFPTLLALIKLLPLSCVFINTTFPLVEFLCLSLMGVNNYTSHCFVGSG